MNNLLPVNGMLLLEPYKPTKRKHDGSSPFATPIDGNNLGTVKYSGHPDYPVGTQVYFAGQSERLTIEGAEIIAIKHENIVAKVVETSDGNQG